MSLTEAANGVETPSTVSYKDQMVGEGKKYATEDDAYKGLVHVNEHAKRLEEENRVLSESKISMNEVLEEIRKPKSNDFELEASEEVAPTPPSFSMEDVTKTVNETLARNATESKAETTTAASISALGEAYEGREAGLRAIKEITQANPALKGTLDTLAATDPAALVTFVTGMKPKAPDGSNAPGGSTETGVPYKDNGLTWAQCQEMRKADPKTYSSPAFRVKMGQAAAKAEAEGRDFFDN
jgi:hypothetical protein